MTTKNVKISTSDNWLDSLIESLKDSEEAAEYLNVILEDDPETDQILRYALRDIVIAHSQINHFSNETKLQAKLQYEKLDKIFSEGGGNEIYILIKLLDNLGFKLTVTVK